MKPVSNENGLSLTILKGDFDHLDPQVMHLDPQVMLGGDPETPSWEEYVNTFNDEYQPHVILLKQAIEQNGLVGYTGQDAQDFTFQFSDGETWTFSWRAWGDLMSAIVNKREGYIAYYM